MKCLQCQEKTINPKFCSKSCSAKYNNSRRNPRTNNSLKKTSDSLKQYRKNNPNHIKSGSQCKAEFLLCPVCEKPFYNKIGKQRKTCSPECGIELIRQSAIAQVRKGGGKQGWYKNIWCHSTWELAFLIWHLDHHLNIIKTDILIEYEFDGKIHQYNPDFIVNHQIYEIKGYNSRRNQAKLEAAKNQGYDIKILYGNEIQFFINYVKSNYQIDNLEELYENYIPLYEIECQECYKQFPTSRENAMYCSRRCSALSNRRKNLKNNKCGWYSK